MLRKFFAWLVVIAPFLCTVETPAQLAQAKLGALDKLPPGDIRRSEMNAWFQ